MQYLLEEKEYDELIKKAKLAVSKEVLQDLCTKVCDNLPVKSWKSEEPQPWTCVLTVGNRDWYCDKCPVIRICPNNDKRCHK